MAAEIVLSEDIEAEFNPHVVIFANDTEYYQKFADHLTKNGFPTTLTSRGSDEPALTTPRPGTVFFISFNLKSANGLAFANIVEQQLNLTCIVFAETEGTATAAKLSSAKMNQTLQHPYNEKNFLMAMQTIVRNRKQQYEKDQRKQNFKMRQQSASEVAKKVNGPEVIIQKAEPAMVTGGSQVFKGESPDTHRAITDRIQSSGFTIVQEGVRDASIKVSGGVSGGDDGLISISGGIESREHTQFVRSKPKKQVTPINKSSEPRPIELEPAQTVEQGSVGGPAESVDTNTPATPVTTSYNRISKVKIEQPLFSREAVWAILATCFVGSLICFYCIYLILSDAF